MSEDTTNNPNVIQLTGVQPALPPIPAYLHSDIFERLVHEENDDLTNLVAYSLYQQRKRCWLKDFLRDNSRYPTIEELKGFSYTYRDDALRSLREEARGMLFSFSKTIVDSQKIEMKEEAFNSRTTEELALLRSMIRKISSYKHHVVGHVVGFIVLVFIAAVVTFALAHEPSLRDGISWVYTVQKNVDPSK